MKRADWFGRALCALVTFGVVWAQEAVYSPEPTLLGVAINQCLSALSNTCALLAAAAFVQGKTSYDLQRLAFCAIVVNFLSFAAFAAKSSPTVAWLNTTISVLSYAQLVLLLWPSNGGIPNPGGRIRLFYVAHFPRAGLHLETRK